MDGASAVAGIIGLAALTLQTTLKLKDLCEGYLTARDEINKTLEALQALEDLLQETQRLASSAPIVRTATNLTRTRMEAILTNCDRDLKAWIYRVDRAIPHNASKVKQRWKKIIVAVDKPKLADLVSKATAWTSRIDGMLGVMRGDLGAATNTALASMIWSDGIFQYKTKKQLKAIQDGVVSLQVTQDNFKSGTFSRLENLGSAVSSIEVNVQELLYRSVQEVPTAILVNNDYGHFLIPYVRNGNFVGRGMILRDVEQKLELSKSNNRVAIYGLGGVGKSQVAIELAYRAHDAVPHHSCFWVSAVSRATFTQGYRQIASSVGVPGSENQDVDVLELVKSWLQQHKTLYWLMIIDNVDDLRILNGETSDSEVFDLLKCLPQCSHGKLLFTTRSKTAALRLTGGGVVVQIPAMEADEAQRLLHVKLDDDDKILKQDCLSLVTALEYLPLPISHAASYIREMDITPSQYLRMFNDDKKITKLLKHTYEDLARDGGQTNTVLTTWRISFEQIQRDSPESADLLRVMGSLHWQDIPQYLLQQGTLEDMSDFSEAVAPLVAFSLVQKSNESNMFSMHRLIHMAIRSWAQTLEWERVAQKLMLQVFPTLELNDVSAGKYTRCRQLLPHAQKIMDLLGSPDAFSLTSVQIKYRIAAFLTLSAQIQQARDLLMSLVEPCKKFTQDGIIADFSEADLEDRITRILFTQGQETIAIQRVKKTLDSRIATLPADHPDIIRAKDLFALGLIAQFKYKEAEEQITATYSLVDYRYDKANILRVALLFSLGAAYTGQEFHQKAADTYKNIMDDLVPVYGERNECVIRCMGYLADSLRCLSQTEESGNLIRRTLTLSEEILGLDHPLTLGTIIRLGSQLMDENDNPGAFAAFERAWKGQQQVYGEYAGITLQTKGRMAFVHESFSGGRRLLEDAINKSRERFGSARLTIALEDELARFYFGRQFGNSETVAYCQVLLKNRKSEGASARALCQAEIFMICTLFIRGNFSEADTKCKDTLMRQTDLLGSNHPDTRRTKDILYSIAIAKHGWDDAEVLLHQQIGFFEETRGQYDCQTLNQKSCLGDMLELPVRLMNNAANDLRADEGCTLMTDAYENLVKYYGKHNRFTVLAASRLGEYYCTSKKKNYKAARDFYEVAVAACIQLFGEEGELTLENQSKLGWILFYEKRFTAANQIFERVHPIQKRHLFMGTVITAFYWGISVASIPGRVAEGYDIMKTEGLDHWRAKYGHIAFVVGPLQICINSIRDILFMDQTSWIITNEDRSGKFEDFEGAFPFTHSLVGELPVKPLTRVRSWHLETACFREYQYRVWPAERLRIFQGLRDGDDLGVEMESEQGWNCTRCHESIPYPDFLYRCYEKSCAGGRYIVCESCRKKGESCPYFEHILTRTKAHLNCDICSQEIQNTYVWRCDLCSDEGYIVCDWCQANGLKKSCPVAEHRLYKRKQPCFGWIKGQDNLECDICSNEIDVEGPYWHCEKCNEGDYDICLECRDKGATCIDQSHVLTKQDQWGHAVSVQSDQGSVAAVALAK